MPLLVGISVTPVPKWVWRNFLIRDDKFDSLFDELTLVGFKN